MSLLVLHLSDIHIKAATDPILKRTNDIASTAYCFLPDIEAIFIIISGDVAYSGTQVQYKLAEKFLNDIKAKLCKESDTPIHIVTCPGNHDCDFTERGSVRDAVIDSILKDGESSIDDDKLEVCVAVQRHFNDFRDHIYSSNVVYDDPLFRRYEIIINGNNIQFDCLNVSFMSKINETQGQLLFPIDRYQTLSEPAATLRFVVMHHPLNWYHQSTYHNFRSFVRSSGDFILTGHEHVPGAGDIDDAYSQPSIYIEGHVLQPHSQADDSGFNLIEINLDENQYKCNPYYWNKNAYVPKELVGAWSSYRNLPSKRNNEFEICSDFIKILDDPGANFSHPAKQSLIISDFYVFPDLEEVVEDGEANRLISSSILQNVSSLRCGILLKGQEKSGKTALLRSVYRNYHESGYVPIIISGVEINGATKKDIRTIIERAIKSQYCEKAVEKWHQLTKGRKVLLLDDFDRINVSDRYRWKIIEIVEGLFDKIILTTDTLIDVNEATSSQAAEILSRFSNYEIQPFGYKLRYDLIRKWRTIGDDYAQSSADLVARVDHAEKILSSVMGQNLVPRVPIYLLTVLQSLEFGNPGDIQNSALGHYYQYLITKSLGEQQVRVDELEEIYNYCANLAWFFHQSDCKEINLRSLRGFNNSYSDEYIPVDLKERLEILYRSRLINKRGNNYSFSYPYIYYFFLGKYFSNELHSNAEVHSLVQRYCSHLYVKEYANTILFLTHFSKDPFIIDCITENLRGLFSDKAPISLEDDTSTINELVEATSRLVFSGGDPEEIRRKKGKLQDEMEKKETGKDHQVEDAEEIEGDLDLSARLNMLFKTIEILGQVLKNYYGTIRNESKVKLMREIYEGPLRALRELLEAVENDKDAIIKDVESAIKLIKKDMNKSDREQLARKALFEFVGMFTYAFLFKASISVGSEHLRDVAHRLIEDTPSIAFRLIELGTRLDSPAALPFDEIKSISRSTERNILAHRLLETIVLRHLYLFRTTDQEKQHICSILGVSMKRQRAIDTRSKSKKLLTKK